MVEAVELAQIERHQRRLAAGGADRVVELIEAALGARQGNDMGTLRRQALGHGGTDAARGAGHQREPAVQPFRHAG